MKVKRFKNSFFDTKLEDIDIEFDIHHTKTSHFHFIFLRSET